VTDVAVAQTQAHAETKAAGPRHRWWVLTVIGIAQLMVVLDVTVVNIALPFRPAGAGLLE
jgi:hypothetical protein